LPAVGEKTMATTINTITLTNANTEYSLNLGTIKSVTLGCRNKLANIRISTFTGKVAGPTEPYLLVPYSSKQTLTFAPAQPVTLYLATDDTDHPVVELISH
jgi:hypothetical protein